MYDLLGAFGDGDAARRAIARVAAVGDAVLAKLPRAGVTVLSTVYDPSDGAGIPEWPDGSAFIGALNDVLADLAARHGALLADVHGWFLGHGATVGDPTQGDARPANRELWYCGLIEPNAWGADQIRRCWWAALG